MIPIFRNYKEIVEYIGRTTAHKVNILANSYEVLESRDDICKTILTEIYYKMNNKNDNMKSFLYPFYTYGSYDEWARNMVPGNDQLKANLVKLAQFNKSYYSNGNTVNRAIAEFVNPIVTIPESGDYVRFVFKSTRLFKHCMAPDKKYADGPRSTLNENAIIITQYIMAMVISLVIPIINACLGLRGYYDMKEDLIKAIRIYVDRIIPSFHYVYSDLDTNMKRIEKDSIKEFAKYPNSEDMTTTEAILYTETLIRDQLSSVFYKIMRSCNVLVDNYLKDVFVNKFPLWEVKGPKLSNAKDVREAKANEENEEGTNINPGN